MIWTHNMRMCVYQMCEKVINSYCYCRIRLTINMKRLGCFRLRLKMKKLTLHKCKSWCYLSSCNFVNEETVREDGVFGFQWDDCSMAVIIWIGITIKQAFKIYETLLTGMDRIKLGVRANAGLIIEISNLSRNFIFLFKWYSTTNHDQVYKYC